MKQVKTNNDLTLNSRQLKIFLASLWSSSSSMLPIFKLGNVSFSLCYLQRCDRKNDGPQAWDLSSTPSITILQISQLPSFADLCNGLPYFTTLGHCTLLVHSNHRIGQFLALDHPDAFFVWTSPQRVVLISMYSFQTSDSCRSLVKSLWSSSSIMPSVIWDTTRMKGTSYVIVH